MNHSIAAAPRGAQTDSDCSLARAWLLMAVAALLASGLFVLLIIASRAPVVGELFPLNDFFHLAIVVHVDFSVLVWFGAVAAALWSLNTDASMRRTGWLALGLVMAGSVLLAIAPFHPGEAIMSNYVPVLDNGWFTAGLLVFAAGLVIAALRQMLIPLPVSTSDPARAVARFGIQSAAIIIVLAAGALLWSWLAMPEFLTGASYYEVLFWGGGHILQFAWVQLMLVAWLWLAAASGVRIALRPNWLVLLLLANFLPAFLGVWAYLQFDVGSPAHRTFFVWLMAAGGGLAAGPIGLALLHGAWRQARAPAASPLAGPLRLGMVWSVVLFGLGGMLGFFIEAGNTIVPAHYHGCIVAITLAFMMLTLHLAPQLGLGQASSRMTRAVAWTYGTGQLLHIAGLAWSGGHGVQRKTAGAAQGLEGVAQMAGMGAMALGGLIAIIGGVLFLIAFGRVLLQREEMTDRPLARGGVGA
ncbi:MAG: cbb3-type cytochrome c oxidase subunit I [Wenzhouxiangellaceae bacterium]